MWQLFLERFIPVMEDDPSFLDVRDGVGTTSASRSAVAESVSASVRGDGSTVPLA